MKFNFFTNLTGVQRVLALGGFGIVMQAVIFAVAAFSLSKVTKELEAFLEHTVGAGFKYTNQIELILLNEGEALIMLTIVGVVAIIGGILFSLITARSTDKSSKQEVILNTCLTNLRNNVLIADANDKLIYMNNSSANALREKAEDLRKSFPNFDPENVIGQSIHIFHKDPDTIRRRLHGLTEGQNHTAIIELGGMKWELAVMGIFQNGKRIGSYAEWADLTAKIAADEERAALGKQIEEAALSVNSASGQISEGNMNLSERTEAQAANIEETTATMQQVTEKVNQNASNAKEALEVAGTTRKAADRGGEVVRDAIAAMEEITSSSAKINDIIGVIDEIAFQTNLLALNAAVEAARAGEQGRGFAVVASEVRTLAGRSAKAAREIKDLITESVANVKGGTEQVNQTGECLNDIITNVQRVADMVQEISSASEEQALSISEINKSVAQMDSFTQQNAALVEEAAAASKSLEEQAAGLITLVSGDKAAKKEQK